MRDAHQQVRFGRLAGAEHAVDVLLPLGLVPRVQQRRAQQEGIGEVVAEHRPARLQQRDHFLILPGLQVAVGEHQVRVLRLGLRRHDALEVEQRLVRPRRLVIGERQIQAERAC